MVTPACHPRTPEVEVEGLQGQGHPPLHSQSETILRYVKPNLKLEEKKKEIQFSGCIQVVGLRDPRWTRKNGKKKVKWVSPKR